MTTGDGHDAVRTDAQTPNALRVLALRDPVAIAACAPVVGVAAPTVARLAAHPPELHLVVTAGTAERALDATSPARHVRARASLWWRDGPTLDGRATGRIGHYAAADDAAASVVLRAALAALKAHGCERAVGPMDASTWFAYRFVTDRRGDLPDPRPPFALEPDQPDAWPAQWRACGFMPLATYTSAFVSDLAPRSTKLAAIRARMAAAGVVLRALDAARFVADLDRIADVATEAFARAFLYEPAERATIYALYGEARPLILPELVLLAERGDDTVGFAFSLPDVLEAQRTGATRTVIVKTVAVRPDRALAGLGTLLVEETHRRAAALGFTQAVHALMHDDNVSRAISDRHGTTMRRYTLFARPLDDVAPDGEPA